MSTEQPDDDQRRRLLASAAAVIAAAPAAAANAPAPAAANIPPGKPGEFDFLSGHWKIAHRKRRANGEWDTFAGEARCWSILGGIASIEELRIPARQFNGMGLRVLDVDKRVWSDFWVNAKSGVLVSPGVAGGFEGGIGIFESVDDNPSMRSRGVWDRITPISCRWEQTFSKDGGKTWELDWSMDWTRA